MLLTQTTPIFRLSQSHLNTLELCPRKFQHTYLEQLNSPQNPEYEESQVLGSRFHLLMQQREMGLPIEALLQEDKQLLHWITAFTRSAPEILTPPISEEQNFRESEHLRTLQVGNYLITVIYDLLVADEQQAQILDWKTYRKTPGKRNLEQNWQTRLYMYVLAETSPYAPENISMTYWFVQSQSKPQSLKFTYSAAQHQKIHQKLHQLLNELTAYLNNYSQQQPLPQLPEGSKHCHQCQFAARCHRIPAPVNTEVQVSANELDNNLLNIATIQEVSL